MNCSQLGTEIIIKKDWLLKKHFFNFSNYILISNYFVVGKCRRQQISKCGLSISNIWWDLFTSIGWYIYIFTIFRVGTRCGLVYLHIYYIPYWYKMWAELFISVLVGTISGLVQLNILLMLYRYKKCVK